jgi:hypothetical protein
MKLIIDYYCGLEGLFPGFANISLLADSVFEPVFEPVFDPEILAVDDSERGLFCKSGGPKTDEFIVLDPVFGPLLLSIGIIRSPVEEQVFESVLDPVLYSVAEINEPIVDSVFDVLDPMPDSSVDLNLGPVENDVRAQSIFEFNSLPIVEPVCESPVVDCDSSTCDKVFTCCSSGSGFDACSQFSLHFLDPQQPMS